MKNITLSLDDATYRQARVAAAARNQSVSALVRDHLKSLNVQPPHAEQVKKLFAALDRARGFRAGARLSREQANARRSATRY